MALAGKREEAERLYINKYLGCPAIAAELGVNEGTVYRWKAEAAERGESEDWDLKRRKRRISAQELIERYIESIRDWIFQILENPALLGDPKVADALTKHFSNIRKLDVRGQYLDVAIDLVKIINRWLAENQPELREKLAPYWDGIMQAVGDYATRKDVPWNGKLKL
jgi:hypothetical protein